MSAMSENDAVFRLVDREVWIVTAAGGGHRGGLTATWVAQASLDPERPVVLISLSSNHHTAELVEASGAFVLHLIDEQDTAWGLHFALHSGHDRDKLAGLASRRAASGSPLLVDCLAWLDCRVFARLAAGDRTYYWADVLASGRPRTGTPLRESTLLAAADAEQRGRLAAIRARDIQLQRAQHERWRASLPAMLRPE